VDCGSWSIGDKSQLGEGSVVIESSHSSEVLFWDSLSIVLQDKAIGVSWVSNNDGFAVSA